MMKTKIGYKLFEMRNDGKLFHWKEKGNSHERMGSC